MIGSHGRKPLILSVVTSLFLSLPMFFPTTAFPQRPLPTDTELRAAYCVPVLQSDIADLRKLLAEVDNSIERIQDTPLEIRQQVLKTLQESKRDLPQKIAERESALNRVQLFILPRMRYLDTSALLGATQRGASDIQQWATVTSKCARQCRQRSTDEATSDQYSSCLKTCTSGDLEIRLSACRNPTWLPF